MHAHSPARLVIEDSVDPLTGGGSPGELPRASNILNSPGGHTMDDLPYLGSIRAGHVLLYA